MRIYLSKEANKTISWTRLNYNEAADKSSNPKVVVIFVTKNEDNTIENSITIAKRSYYKPEVLVVDAHSTDKTAELASKTGAIVILQSKQMFPGKGLAMKEGLKEAVIKLAD